MKKRVIGLFMACIVTCSVPYMTVYAEAEYVYDLEAEHENQESTVKINEFLYSDNVGDDETTDDLLSSLWLMKDQNGKGHTNLPECVMNNFSGKNKELIHTCLVFGSEKADMPPLHDPNTKITQLHGLNNYVLHLNALWLYAKKISVSGQTDKNCKNQILKEVYIKSSEERDTLEKLLTTVPRIYTMYKKEKGHQPSNFEKQYLILGLALHLIGDIYAHRTLVTIEAINDALNHGWIKESDFKDFEDFKARVKQGKVRCSRIDNFMKKKIPHNSNVICEDNTAFMPNRFVYSKKTCKAFISNYVRSGSVFNPDYIKWNAVDGIVLQSFDSYR